MITILALEFLVCQYPFFAHPPSLDWMMPCCLRRHVFGFVFLLGVWPVASYVARFDFSRVYKFCLLRLVWKSMEALKFPYLWVSEEQGCYFPVLICLQVGFIRRGYWRWDFRALN